ncbi:MAG TPA: tyrosine-protein phosphatase [Smithellaceae bacterium]|nr:tyrosine-protein phosphatase [Smithellaceae bacterium]
MIGKRTAMHDSQKEGFRWIRNRFVTWCLASMIVFLAIGAACVYVITYANRTLHPVIDKTVYRSGQLDGEQLHRAIRKYNLKTIINLRGDNEGRQWYETERQIAQAHGAALYDFSFDASSLPPVRLVIALLHCLDSADKPLLIHCRQGIDRTSFVSALILALEENVPYETALKQMTWRFGIIPGRTSVGPLFFGQYEAWRGLSRLGHSPDLLRSWIHRTYLDDYGSIEYSLDTVEGRLPARSKPREDRSITLPTGLSSLSIAGWAYDYRHGVKMKEMTVGLNNAFAPAAFIHSRPDVARHLNLSGDDRQGPPYLGWSARFDGTSLSPGAYRVTLHFPAAEGQTVTAPTGCIIHIR